MAPNVYQRIVDLLHKAENSPAIGHSKLKLAYQSCFVNDRTDGASGAPVVAPADVDVWSTLIAKAMAQPAQHRSRYQALNMLLPKIGAHRFLALQPGAIIIQILYFYK